MADAVTAPPQAHRPQDTRDVNIAAVAAELAWLATVIDMRLHDFLAGTAQRPLPEPPVPDPASRLAGSIAAVPLDAEARLLVALALAPHLAPALLDGFFVRNPGIDRPFSEFGGQPSGGHGAFLPTGETALFLLGGTDLAVRARAARFFDPDHPLRTGGIVTFDAPRGGPATMGTLSVTVGHLALLTTGQVRKPDYSPDFPARRLTTALTWADLVLAPEVVDQLDHIAAWLDHEAKILGDWGLARSLAPGYRCLFYGPPGTGKTLSAAILGQRAGLDVYRIDLSMVVSKYIGETEKNLAGLFDQAAHKNWILFFDEADALFGTRSSSGGSANDRYANQEVAYLLQRIETCPSLVILATNLRGNIDDAFSRRFQSLVGFTRPDAGERLRLWQGVLAGKVPVAGDVDLAVLARDHDLAGGAIINAVRHAAILALRHGRPAVSQADFLAGVSSELRKEGRTA